MIFDQIKYINDKTIIQKLQRAFCRLIGGYNWGISQNFIFNNAFEILFSTK